MGSICCYAANVICCQGKLVAITIRNKETEAIIRRLGKRRNEGPSAVVARLAKEAVAREGQVSEEEYQRRMKAWDEVMALAPPRDPNLTWDEVEREMQSLFDYVDDEESEAECSS